VLVPDRSGGGGGNRRRRGHIGKQLAIRSPELEAAFRPGRHPIALLVDRSVVTTAEQDEVGQARRATVRPVTYVMAFNDACLTARKPATPVAVM